MGSSFRPYLVLSSSADLLARTPSPFSVTAELVTDDCDEGVDCDGVDAFFGAASRNVASDALATSAERALTAAAAGLQGPPLQELHSQILGKLGPSS